jgi:hypothetical protein
MLTSPVSVNKTLWTIFRRPLMDAQEVGVLSVEGAMALLCERLPECKAIRGLRICEGGI